jgi:hypothetical protein
MRNAAGLGLTVKATDLKQPLDPSACPLLHVTGVAGITADEQVKQNLKAYIKAGGVLLADAAGGNERFAESFAKLIAELYGEKALAAPARNLPFMADASEDGKVWFRHRFGLPRAQRALELLTLEQDDRPGVIFLPWDFTEALVGNPCLSAVGLTPESADKLVTAICKWRASSPPTPATPVQPRTLGARAV